MTVPSRDQRNRLTTSLSRIDALCGGLQARARKRVPDGIRDESLWVEWAIQRRSFARFAIDVFDHAAAGETALLSYCIVAELAPISESLVETTRAVLGGFMSAKTDDRSVEHSRACEDIMQIQATIESVLALLEGFVSDEAHRGLPASQSVV